MTLGEKIQELRRKNAMSQDVLAEKLEVSRQAVSKWERDDEAMANIAAAKHNHFFAGSLRISVVVGVR